MLVQSRLYGPVNSSPVFTGCNAFINGTSDGVLVSPYPFQWVDAVEGNICQISGNQYFFLYPESSDPLYFIFRTSSSMKLRFRLLNYSHVAEQSISFFFLYYLTASLARTTCGLSIYSSSSGNFK